MAENTPWPYGPMPSAADVLYGSVRYVIQLTEDGYYGFAFRGSQQVAAMVGPCKSLFVCDAQTRKAAPPGAFA